MTNFCVVSIDPHYNEYILELSTQTKFKIKIHNSLRDKLRKIQKHGHP